MKKIIAVLAVLLLAAQPLLAQTLTFNWQNTQRQYMLFEPSGRDGALPVMYFLHGLGDNITRCNNEMHFGNLAERYGWVVVVPQATSVSGYTMWNAGLGGTADDAGFLLALLDTLIADGKVNADSVFFTGFSMGGFMTHRMAIEHGDRITACAPVSGLIAFAFANDVPPVPVRMLHIHGTSDDVVGWNGGSAYFGTIGISVDSVVSFWTGWNNCDATPTVDTLPHRVNDGLRFVRFTYSGEAEFQLLKVIGGSHNWYQDSTTHDIDYFDEIHTFFLGGSSSLGFTDPEEDNTRFDVWPNPTTGTLYVRTPESLTLTVYDSMGRSVMRNALGSGVNSIDLQGMPEGLYVLVDGNGSSRKILRVK
jgi:polyhydroxybutyrate depolymerase